MLTTCPIRLGLADEYEAARRAFGEAPPINGETEAEWRLRLDELRFEYRVTQSILRLDVLHFGPLWTATHRYTIGADGQLISEPTCRDFRPTRSLLHGRV